MNLPAILSAAAIQKLAVSDTHAVRIILMSPGGPTNFTLRGTGRRRGKYILHRDGIIGRHILDIPISVWNHGIPNGRYQDNASIAHDLLSKPNPLTPFVTDIVPWNGAQPEQEPQPTKAEPEAITDAFPAELVDAVETISLRLLALTCEAEFKVFATPDITAKLDHECAPTINAFLQANGRNDVVEFIKTITHQEDVPARITAPEAPAAVSTTPAAPKPPATKSETPAAKRMRNKRARDKKKREDERKAKLQPA